MSDNRPTREECRATLKTLYSHSEAHEEIRRLAIFCMSLLDENANLSDANKNLQHRIANQRSEIKNRLLQIYGMERGNAWLRGVNRRVRTALGLDGETLQTTGISDPAEAAIRICSERDELRSENANLKRDKERQWQPIETAPKDGTVILTFRPLVFCKVHISSWCRNARDEWYWASHNGASQRWNRENPPTHWMPLPDPPAMESTASEGEPK